MSILSHWSIRSKILLLSILSVLLPIIISNTLSYRRANQIIEQEFRQYTEQALQLAVENVDDILDEAEKISRAPYLNEAVLEIFKTPLDMSDISKVLENRRTVNSFISRIYQLSNDVFGLYVFTENNENYSTDLTEFPINHEYDFRAQHWYDELKSGEKPSIVLPPGYPKHTVQNSELVISHITGIRDIEDETRLEDEPKMIAFVIIDILYSKIEKLLRTVSPRRSGGLYILNENGTIFFSRNPEELGLRIHAILQIAEGLDDKADHIVSVVESIRTGWKYVNLVDRNDLVTNTQIMIRFSVITGGVAALLVLSASILLASAVTSPLLRLTALMKKVEDGNLTVKFDYQYKNEIGYLSRGFNNMVANIRELMEKVYEYRLTSREAEIELLHSKINPHFLYNTLQSIQMKAVVEGKKEIAEMVDLLGSYMRFELDMTTEFITLEKELEHIQEYVELQRIRFGSKLRFQTEIEELCRNFGLPKLIIQPLIENSIQHGLEDKTGQWSIILRALVKDSRLVLAAVDNGQGMSPQELKRVNKYMENNYSRRKSLGLRNIYRRLSLLFPEEFSIDIKSQKEVGTTVTVLLPLIDEKNIKKMNRSMSRKLNIS